ncbi:prophage PSPPH03, putative tail assembly protein I [Pseudomonas savastanoi pv. phaseolicola 1448A]|uniref:Prophage PSPPH03, putative tail assembly protein I n=1 Tax=Pseudomonas savastanoi pv. phaseolicola (strain 1448A / Race 6) TaxID=264730 RepID=Q48JQ6_PSE14|nr:prophage PSPPH03, putative tail assembly protein I [Pseudomonas savastanoi pv. phaseolicola 1448A]
MSRNTSSSAARSGAANRGLYLRFTRNRSRASWYLVIRIVPLIQGSKQAGLFQVVLGVALVVAGAFTGGLSSGVGMALLAGGAAVGLGGVVQMLSPTTTASVGSNNDDGNNPSYGFGGAVTTVAQGNPYPVLYGEREIGGAVESGGIYTQDQI